MHKNQSPPSETPCHIPSSSSVPPSQAIFSLLEAFPQAGGNELQSVMYADDLLLQGRIACYARAMHKVCTGPYTWTHNIPLS